MPSVIPLITHPHTGTHFMRAFLCELPGVERVINVNHVIHYGAAALPDAPCVLWGHYDPSHWDVISPICRINKAIVPVRDPLAVAISHKIRGNKMNFGFWVDAIDRFDEHDVHYIPLDTTKSYEGRLLNLMLATTAVGYGHVADDQCRKWAVEWPREKHHCSGKHDLKVMYDNNDIKALERSMPDIIRELKGVEPVLKPWLRRMGYENLLWFYD